MAATEIMQMADLNEMEARVDVGEGDVALIQPGQPATLDDGLEVSVDVTDARLASLHIRQQAWRRDPAGPALLAEGTIRIGCVDAGTFRPRRIPIDVFDRIR